MSLTHSDVEAAFREYFLRIEEVLSGMDVTLARLETRVATLEGRWKAIAAEGDVSLEHRIARLEGQLASLAAAFTDESETSSGSGIYLGR